jgi:hypothetical protein
MTISKRFAQSGLAYTGMLPLVPRPPCTTTVQSTGSAFPMASIITLASPA